MSVQEMARVLFVTSLKQIKHGKALLVAAGNYADENGFAYPGDTTLADMTDLTERHVKRIKKQLVNIGELYLVQKKTGRGHKAGMIILAGLDRNEVRERLKVNLELTSAEADKLTILIMQKRQKWQVGCVLKAKEKGDNRSKKRVTSAPERVTFKAEKGDIYAPYDPLNDPSSDPSSEPLEVAPVGAAREAAPPEHGEIPEMPTENVVSGGEVISGAVVETPPPTPSPQDAPVQTPPLPLPASGEGERQRKRDPIFDTIVRRGFKFDPLTMKKEDADGGWVGKTRSELLRIKPDLTPEYLNAMYDAYYAAYPQVEKLRDTVRTVTYLREFMQTGTIKPTIRENRNVQARQPANLVTNNIRRAFDPDFRAMKNRSTSYFRNEVDMLDVPADFKAHLEETYWKATSKQFISGQSIAFRLDRWMEDRNVG